MIFPFLINFLVKDKDIVYVSIFFNILGFVPGFYKYKDNLAFQKKLKARGLTNEDLFNIEFVKSWEEIRRRGLIKYSLIDGGIFFGLALCTVISIAVLIINPHTIDYIRVGPSNMFNFIGYTYLAGATAGIIIYRVSWVYKEQKFIRLTGPLH